jgi:hypothetical protein
MALDHDLSALSKAELVAEAMKLRQAIRAHRDASGHDLCWFHPELWSALPEERDKPLSVPPWPVFMRGCVAYRASLDRELPGTRVDPREYGE